MPESVSGVKDILRINSQTSSFPISASAPSSCSSCSSSSLPTPHPLPLGPPPPLAPLPPPWSSSSLLLDVPCRAGATPRYFRNFSSCGPYRIARTPCRCLLGRILAARWTKLKPRCRKVGEFGAKTCPRWHTWGWLGALPGVGSDLSKMGENQKSDDCSSLWEFVMKPFHCSIKRGFPKICFGKISFFSCFICACRWSVVPRRLSVCLWMLPTLLLLEWE